MLTWAAITKWDFSYNISMLVPLSRQVCIYFGGMVVTESVLLRYYSEFVLKHIASLKDDFTVYFMSFLNLMFGLLLGFTLLYAGCPNESPRLQGYFSELRDQECFSPG